MGSCVNLPCILHTNHDTKFQRNRLIIYSNPGYRQTDRQTDKQTHRQTDNRPDRITYASAEIPTTHIQWLISPLESRVKIGLIPLPGASSPPHFPQLPSKIYLGKMQMSKCTMRIDVTITRIINDKCVLHRAQTKQWSKWNIGAQSAKSVQ